MLSLRITRDIESYLEGTPMTYISFNAIVPKSKNDSQNLSVHVSLRRGTVTSINPQIRTSHK